MEAGHSQARGIACPCPSKSLLPAPPPVRFGAPRVPFRCGPAPVRSAPLAPAAVASHQHDLGRHQDAIPEGCTVRGAGRSSPGWTTTRANTHCARSVQSTRTRCIPIWPFSRLNPVHLSPIPDAERRTICPALFLSIALLCIHPLSHFCHQHKRVLHALALTPKMTNRHCQPGERQHNPCETDDVEIPAEKVGCPVSFYLLLPSRPFVRSLVTRAQPFLPTALCATLRLCHAPPPCQALPLRYQVLDVTSSQNGSAQPDES